MRGMLRGCCPRSLGPSPVQIYIPVALHFSSTPTTHFPPGIRRSYLPFQTQSSVNGHLSRSLAMCTSPSHCQASLSSNFSSLALSLAAPSSCFLQRCIQIHYPGVNLEINHILLQFFGLSFLLLSFLKVIGMLISTEVRSQQVKWHQYKGITHKAGSSSSSVWHWKYSSKISFISLSLTVNSTEFFSLLDTMDVDWQLRVLFAGVRHLQLFYDKDVEKLRYKGAKHGALACIIYNFQFAIIVQVCTIVIARILFVIHLPCRSKEITVLTYWT